jgi:hypothetical protein
VLFQPDSAPPVIVKLVTPEERSEFQQLSDILFGALGLTGMIILGALLLGVVIAGVMFWLRSRREPGSGETPPHIRPDSR